MKPWDEYQCNLEYPSLRKYREERQPAIMALPASERPAAIEKLRVESTSWFKEQIRPYNEESSRLLNLFWADCRTELGYDKFLKPPAVEAIENSAWDAGHSAGYQEVFSVLSDIVDIARIVVENCIKEPSA